MQTEAPLAANQERGAGKTEHVDATRPAIPLAAVPGPRGIPVLGNLLQVDSLYFHRQMEEWAEQYGRYYRFCLGRQEVLAVADSDAIAALLRDRPQTMQRSTRSSEIIHELGSSGVFSANGEDWRMQRKLVMRALTPEVVRNFFPTLSMMTDRMRQRWAKAAQTGQTIDVLRDLKSFALDVTIYLAMGQDINTLEKPDDPLQRDIGIIFNRIARRYTSPLPYWRYLRLPADREADASAQRIQAAVAGFIAEARRQLEEQPELRAKPANMLQALIVARDEPDSGFEDRHVIGNAVTMVFAGEDTTSNTTAWLVYFLAQHAAAAARLRGEADEVLAGDPVLRHFDRLERFTYLDAATNEAMRIKPVAPFLVMEAANDVRVGDIIVPKGAFTALLFRHATRLDGGFDQPEAFLPERFLRDENNPTAGDPSRKMFPFGGGPRFCPGRFLALAEIKVIISMLVRNFELEFDDSAPAVKETFTFTMTPDSLPVRLKPRTT